jgi:hypothetical protein
MWILLLLESLDLFTMLATGSENQEDQKGNQGNDSDASYHDSSNWTAS